MTVSKAEFISECKDWFAGSAYVTILNPAITFLLPYFCLWKSKRNLEQGSIATVHEKPSCCCCCWFFFLFWTTGSDGSPLLFSSTSHLGCSVFCCCFKQKGLDPWDVRPTSQWIHLSTGKSELGRASPEWERYLLGQLGFLSQASGFAGIFFAFPGSLAWNARFYLRSPWQSVALSFLQSLSLASSTALAPALWVYWGALGAGHLSDLLFSSVLSNQPAAPALVS